MASSCSEAGGLKIHSCYSPFVTWLLLCNLSLTHIEHDQSCKQILKADQLTNHNPSRNNPPNKLSLLLFSNMQARHRSVCVGNQPTKALFFVCDQTQNAYLLHLCISIQGCSKPLKLLHSHDASTSHAQGKTTMSRSHDTILNLQLHPSLLCISHQPVRIHAPVNMQLAGSALHRATHLAWCMHTREGTHK